ncbi:MAG: histidine triad nucleotide-binding protein [Endozoicomonadaceae bacterium]|nr:histidine triad nucleotide-binding protein [Endozoicomonadaceae bacterium]
MTDCIFCKIVEGTLAADIIYEDDFCIAFKDLYPKAPVHVLVIPKKHIENLAALRAEDQPLMGHMLLKLTGIAESQGLEDGFRTITNTGPGGGQEVYHLHFHILGGNIKPA